MWGGLFKMMTGTDMLLVSLSRHSARAHRSARRAGAGPLFCNSPTGSIEYIKAGALRALAVTTATRAEALPDIPTVGEFLPGYEATELVRPRRTESHADRDRQQTQQGDQRGPRRSQNEGPACRPRWHGAAGLARRFGKLIAEETEKWGKAIRAANIKPE